MIIKPIFEFLVWDNCHNNCKFCFQRKNPNLFSFQQQNLIINKVLTYLKSDKFIEGSHIMLCGGELFDDSKRTFLIDFFEAIAKDFMVSNKIDLIYINTNLIFNKECLDNVITILHNFKKYNLLHRIKFTTSYDLEGRFNKEKELLCLNNIHIIKELFPELNVIANIILTKEFCNSVLQDTFNLFKFLQENQITTNLIPYIILDNNLSATRDEIFSCLQKLYLQEPRFIIDWIKNINLKQPRIILSPRNFNKDIIFDNKECKNDSCGHSINFKRYSNSNTCFVCDLLEVFNGIL